MNKKQMLKTLSVKLKITKECTGIQAIRAQRSRTPEKENVVRTTASHAQFTMTKISQPSSFACYLNFILGFSVVSFRPLAILILSGQFCECKHHRPRFWTHTEKWFPSSGHNFTALLLEVYGILPYGSYHLGSGSFHPCPECSDRKGDETITGNGLRWYGLFTNIPHANHMYKHHHFPDTVNTVAAMRYSSAVWRKLTKPSKMLQSSSIREQTVTNSKRIHDEVKSGLIRGMLVTI
jgi:hypothetical protein